ncbi:hypothetical protein ACFYP4_07490 [Streptomyces sp. NPDC005551]|uniref:hypothetical protein n=1 Tax=Streptomyces sp. NPDC005551 TaxID=3364725 RepID=UPI003694DCDC
MGSLRLTLCTGAVLAAAFTPAAYAADAAVSVTPSPPAPGSDITLRATGCKDRTGVAKSPAFVADARLTGGDGALVGESRVRSSLKPGTYGVQVTCDGVDDKVRGTLTVARADGPGRAASDPASRPADRPEQPASSAPASPVAPVRAGGGGTAHFASVDTRATGPGTGQAVIGLVLASAAAVAVAVRSARRDRGGG